jgi:hypothetical protein
MRRFRGFARFSAVLALLVDTGFAERGSASKVKSALGGETRSSH